jgi:hypothetical protein
VKVTKKLSGFIYYNTETLSVAGVIYSNAAHHKSLGNSKLTKHHGYSRCAQETLGEILTLKESRTRTYISPKESNNYRLEGKFIVLKVRKRPRFSLVMESK